MTNLLQRFTSGGEQRHAPVSSLDDLGFLFGGMNYPLLNTTWTQGDTEEVPNTYEAYATRFLRGNPVVFAAMSIRMAVFSQARLIWRRRLSGQVVDTFTDARLSKFQRPWPGGTTSDLLARMLLHADTAGNAFVLNGGDRLHLMRPDRVTIALGSQIDADDPASAEDVQVAGYFYKPEKNSRARFYLPNEVAHFAPTPDPNASFRGMSWLTPVIRDVQGDDAATRHKLKFFENSATPQMVVSFDKEIAEAKVKAFRELMETDHAGVANAYKTLYLGGGADATVVGKDFQQIDFAKTQGKGETRILMAAGIPPVVAGASEGLSGSSLNAGNYNAAKRAFSDIRLQHLWTNAVSSLSTIAGGSEEGVELWFDKSEIPFLQDDLKDTAEIQQKRATAIRTLTDAGYDAETVVSAVVNDDYTQLRHNGLFSVQLQPPGTDQEGNTDE